MSASPSRSIQGRVLVTGAAGMLGSQLLLTAPAGIDALGTDLSEARDGAPELEFVGVDLTDGAAVEALFAGADLAGVIHPAAYTAVDKAEEEEELAHRVNALAAGHVARAAARQNIPMVMVSTDFVFDGSKRTPYLPDEPTAGLGVYGRTKLEGERLALEAHPGGVAILRTQWLYGPRGAHFPGTMMRLASERDSLRVVSDQIGSPTSTLELAPALWDALGLGARGVYHAACEGEASWFDFAVETLRLSGSTTSVAPCTTEEFPRPAPRPAYSVLDCGRLTALRGHSLKPWRDALADFLSLDGQ